MEHLIIVMSMASIVLGAAALTTIRANHKRYQLKPIKSFSIYLLLHVLYIVGIFVYAYMVQNTVSIWPLVEGLLAQIVPLTGAASYLFFLQAVSKMLKQGAYKILKQSYSIMLGIIVIGRIAENIFYSNDFAIINLASSGLLLAGVVFFYQIISMILLLLAGFSESDQQRKLALTYFSSIFLITMVIWSLSVVVHELNIINYLTFVILVHLQIYIVYASIILFSERFIRNYFIRLEPDLEEHASFAETVLQYSITKREKEIVELICKGKPNKEIADQLFISIATVKEHITNIYRKTKVGNRVSLTNLFTTSTPLDKR